MQKKTESNVGKVIAGVAGIAALSVAAYMLFGPEGKKNRKQISGWSVKMKGEIIEKFEKAKEVTEPIFNKIVDDAAIKYAKVKGVSTEELNSVVADLRKHWKALMRDVKAKTPARKSRP